MAFICINDNFQKLIEESGQSCPYSLGKIGQNIGVVLFVMIFFSLIYYMHKKQYAVAKACAVHLILIISLSFFIMSFLEALAWARR